MTWDYGCPTCGATLNPRETIVLVGEHAGTRVLVGFHPQPGSYDTYVGLDPEVSPRIWPGCPPKNHSSHNDLQCGLLAHMEPPYLGLDDILAQETPCEPSPSYAARCRRA